MKRIINSVLIIVTLIFIMPSQVMAKGQNQSAYKSLDDFANILNLLEKNYVEKIDPQEVIQGAIKGMISSLDPHSSYMTAAGFRDLQAETEGSFNGIGIEVTIKNGILAVVSPIEGSPAFTHGIKAGDKIIKINGTYTKDLSMMEAVNLLRGKKGTKVTLSIYRIGWTEIRDFTMKRDTVPLHSVKSRMLRPGYGYIRITNFQAKTTIDTLTALKKLSKKSPLRGLVLDLRNNPGGLLEQAVSVVNIFQNKGIIVSTRGRMPNQNVIYRAHGGGIKYAFPIVVLVNVGSASASEIVAGALQDNKRALILGTQTFGKGSVQTVFPLNNGGGIRLTTARYYTPNGRSIQAMGITPDFIIPLRQNTAAENQGNIHQFIREKDLKHHMKNDNKCLATKGKSAKAIGDNQLKAALMLLRGVNVLHRK
ncbi:MAG: S41 family peptidase [Deltaproteobacteria bacterium]|nr:S41 family peptidase [Deltaproteobacteria bacterium]